MAKVKNDTSTLDRLDSLDFRRQNGSTCQILAQGLDVPKSLDHQLCGLQVLRKSTP